MGRAELELKAAAVMELRRRKQIAANDEPIVYGIYAEGPKLLRCWQKNHGKWEQVKKPPVVTLPEKVERALITPKAIKILKGGRGSAKSESVSKIMDGKMKDEGRKIGCFREFQNSIEDSVHSILCKNITNHNLQGFDPTNNKINHENGAKARYRGLARNPSGVKGMDDFHDAWFEEAQTASYKSIELLEPTFRNDGAEIWYTLNPGSKADPIYIEHVAPYEKQLLRDGFYEDESTLIIEINWTDNPWFPESLDIKRRKNKASWTTAKYRHIWEGETLDEVPGSIIPQEWFDAAIDAHIKLGFEPRGALIASHDPSDEGDDSKGYVLRHGSVVLDVAEMPTMDVNDGCDWALDKAIAANADTFVWDCDGLGVTLKRQVKQSLEGKKIEYLMFKGSESVDDPNAMYQEAGKVDHGKEKSNKQTFRNKRAQYYWKLRDRFYNTWRAIEKSDYIDPCDMISLSSDIDCINQLRSEVCRIPKKPSGNGLIQIMSKVDMARPPFSIPSPNMADSLMMSMVDPVAAEAHVELKFTTIRL